MDDEALEQFRSKWKQELTSKSKTTVPDDEPASSQAKEGTLTLKLDQYSNHNENTNNQTLESSDSLDNQPSSSYARKEGHDLISTCYQQPDSCYYSFSIVGKLLNRKETSSIESSTCSSGTKPVGDSEKRKQTHDQRRYKKFKVTDLKNIFTERQESSESLREEKLLDKLIADIDEITEIPFFDISIPREVAVKIFQHLGIKDLCSCAQVSKSWHSLAEDELLWCRICHDLGQETVYTTREKTHWKQIVRHNVERRRLLITNWKNRTGEVQQLEYVKGNILCAVHSVTDTVVTGYTNGEVKLWDLTSSDSCVFQPSSTALVVRDDWTESNTVESVVTTGKTTVAAYRQGHIDIWNLDSGTQPIHTHTPAGVESCKPPGLSLSKGGNCVVARYSCHLDLLDWDQQSKNFVLSTIVDNRLPIEHVKFFEMENDNLSVIYSDTNIVKLCRSASHETGFSTGYLSAEIHNLIDAPINVIDCRPENKMLAVAHGSFMNLTDGCRIKLYDLGSSKLVQTLKGCALRVTCMNYEESPAHQLVIGTGDRKVHMFDTRIPEPVQTYSWHSAGVVCVQMDDWKVVSGAWDGFVCVWDRRMAIEQWNLHNRHPVGYSHFNDKYLVVGNVPSQKFPDVDEFESATHRRFRGTVYCYNFLADLTTQDVPEICLSSYDQPEASKYNISLAVPYDMLNY